MTPSSERSFAKELNIWVQTMCIIIATLWGAYTFIYKEIMLPKAVPVNVSVDLQLKKIGRPNSQVQQGENKALIAVEMAVSATNPSSREVYLLPSVWIAHGYKVNALSENKGFAKQATLVLDSQDKSQLEKHASTAGIADGPVAIGRLFPDNSLKPNEKVAQKLLFHVPVGRYDFISVEALMPTMAKKEGAVLVWKYDEKDGSLVPIMFKIAKNGERKEMKNDKDGHYMDDELELQTAASRSTLSLWQ